MRKTLMLSGCALLAGLVLSGCTAFAPTATQKGVDTPKPMQTTAVLDQQALFQSLSGDSIMGVVILNPTQEELELAENVDQVYPDQEYGEYMLIVPRLPGSTITLQEISYDTNTGEITDIQDVHTTSGPEPVSMLVQQDIPEGFPTLRVVIEADGRTGTYELSYYGKGDGRRDFYIMWEREG